MDPKNVSKRAHRILEIAARMAEKLDGWRVRSQIEEMQLYYDGYAEPGYHAPESGIVATGNWNTVTRYDKEAGKCVDVSDIPKRVGKLFEAMSIKCEWGDEWSTCGECRKLVRTSPDSYSYQPSYVVGDGELLCAGCVKEDPEAHLAEHEGEVSLILADIDPEEHGYVKVNESPYESGWHPGQTDDPKVVAKELRAKKIDRFVFRKDEQSQFYSKWSVYVHEDEADRL